jgi:hypothetical protein
VSARDTFNLNVGLSFLPYSTLHNLMLTFHKKIVKPSCHLVLTNSMRNLRHDEECSSSLQLSSCTRNSVLLSSPKCIIIIVLADHRLYREPVLRISHVHDVSLMFILTLCLHLLWISNTFSFEVIFQSKIYTHPSFPFTFTFQFIPVMQPLQY